MSTLPARHSTVVLITRAARPVLDEVDTLAQTFSRGNSTSYHITGGTVTVAHVPNSKIDGLRAILGDLARDHHPKVFIRAIVGAEKRI